MGLILELRPCWWCLLSSNICRTRPPPPYSGGRPPRPPVKLQKNFFLHFLMWITVGKKFRHSLLGEGFYLLTFLTYLKWMIRYPFKTWQHILWRKDNVKITNGKINCSNHCVTQLWQRLHRYLCFCPLIGLILSSDLSLVGYCLLSSHWLDIVLCPLIGWLLSSVL